MPGLSTKNFRRSLLAGTVIVTGAVSSAAFAQAAASSGLEEVVVTAQRRSERVQDVPISITAVSDADLKRNAITDISRLDSVAPGFVFGRSGPDTRPAIRGAITASPTAASNPTVGFYIDGVYQSRIQQANMPMVDIERVEVQMGPQGTLYGRNTYGGNISVTNHQPVKFFESGATLETGSLTKFSGQGFVNVPVNDSLQLRFAGLYSQRDGYVKSVNNPELDLGGGDNVFIRGIAKYKPNDVFEAQLSAAYWHEYGQGGGTGYKIGGTLVNPATGRGTIRGVAVPFNPSVKDGIPDINGFDIGTPVSSDPYTNEWDYVSFENVNDAYVTLNMSYQLGDWASLRSITGYTKHTADRTADNDQTAILYPAPGITSGFPGSGYQDFITKVKTTSQELQLASQSTKPLQWIAGLFYMKDQIDESNTQLVTAPTATGFNTGNRTVIDLETYAVFAQGSYYVVPDRLRLTAGARYTVENKGYDLTNYRQVQIGGVATGPYQTLATQTGAPEFKATTYRLGADFFVTRQNMLYASVSTGYISGGFNNNTTNPLIPATYQPQKVTAYEVGSKNQFFDNRLQLNVSLFYNDYTNLQLTIFNQAANLSYLAAAGAATGKGAEFSAIAQPIEGLRITAGLSLLDAKYTDYLRPGPFPTTGGDPALLDLKGYRIPLSPKWRSTVSVSYDVQMGDAGVLTPYVSWLHSDSFFTTDFNMPVFDRQKAFDRWDANLSWSPKSQRFTIKAYVLNIGDVAVLQRSLFGTSQRLQLGYAPPREYGLSISAKFGGPS